MRHIAGNGIDTHVLSCRTLQSQRGAFDTLPSRVVAAVPRDRLASSPHYDAADPRRNAPFMELALCAAAEVRAPLAWIVSLGAVMIVEWQAL